MVMTQVKVVTAHDVLQVEGQLNKALKEVAEESMYVEDIKCVTNKEPFIFIITYVDTLPDEGVDVGCGCGCTVGHC